MILTIWVGRHAMKTSKFTEAQIAFALKHGGVGTSELRRMRQLEGGTPSSGGWWRT